MHRALPPDAEQNAGGHGFVAAAFVRDDLALPGSALDAHLLDPPVGAPIAEGDVELAEERLRAAQVRSSRRHRCLQARDHIVISA
jgi:hypothetical protein